MVKAPRRCSECSELGHDRRSCPRITKRKAKGKEFDPWSDLEWGDHLEAQKIVEEHPDGMTLEEVGKVLGVTRERIRQIEVVAIKKLNEGTGDFDPVQVEGITIPVGLCKKCGAGFVRRGRSKVCEACTKPKDRIRRSRQNRSTVTPRGDRVRPPTPPPPPPAPGPAAVTIVFDLSGWS